MAINTADNLIYAENPGLDKSPYFGPLDNSENNKGEKNDGRRHKG
jgi:hypothetical protein